MNETTSAILFVLVFFSPVFYQLFLVIRENKKGTKVVLIKLKKYLFYSILVFIPIAIFVLTLNKINFINYQSPMPYSQIEKITFLDFKGYEFFKKAFNGSNQFAYIVTEIDSEINNDNVRIESFFHPARSFVYNSHAYDNDLLAHELYHFRITEIYARKIRQELKGLEQVTKNEINGIIKQKKRNEREYQRKYDFDTYHSQINKEQNKYEKEIDSLLLLLNEFKEPKIRINVKN